VGLYERDVYKRLPIVYFQRRITAIQCYIIYNLYHNAVRISNNLSPLGLHRLRYIYIYYIKSEVAPASAAARYTYSTSSSSAVERPARTKKKTLAVLVAHYYTTVDRPSKGDHHHAIIIIIIIIITLGVALLQHCLIIAVRDRGHFSRQSRNIQTV